MDEARTARAEDEALARLQRMGAIASATTRYGDEAEQVLETYGDGAERRLVLVHGGFFRPGIDRTHLRPLARHLAAKGWHVHLPEYRRAPGRPEETLADVVALDAHLTRSADWRPTVWAGHSAGGFLVLWRALRSGLPPVPVVALAPITDLTRALTEGLGDGAVADWLGHDAQTDLDTLSGLEVAYRLRSLGGRPGPEVPLCVHGRDDATVPVDYTVASGGLTRVVAGAHHLDLIDPRSEHVAVVEHALEAAASLGR